MQVNQRFTRVGDGTDLVGESPLWDHRCHCLFWVDIVGRAVRRLDPATNRVSTWLVDDFPTALALTDVADAVMLTQGLQFGRFSLLDGRFVPLLSLESGSGAMRLNEGKCDPAGRFWTASMDNNLHPDGSPRRQGPARGQLFSIEGDRLAGPWSGELGIPNTMAWSPAGDMFYFGDTTRNVIWAFDYDQASGAIGRRRVFAEGGPGKPDGSAMDAEGFLWNARFGAGCLLRFAPDGRLDSTIDIPAINPTACTFGGPDLRTLYVTSGRFGIDHPGVNDGALFAAESPVAGLRSTPFKATPA